MSNRSVWTAPMTRRHLVSGDFARLQNLVIVTKDADFQERSLIAGAPPKVVWIRRGNCSTSDIEAILRRHSDEALQLMQGDEVALVLF